MGCLICRRRNIWYLLASTQNHSAGQRKIVVFDKIHMRATQGGKNKAYDFCALGIIFYLCNETLVSKVLITWTLDLGSNCCSPTEMNRLSTGSLWKKLSPTFVLWNVPTSWTPPAFIIELNKIKSPKNRRFCCRFGFWLCSWIMLFLALLFWDLRCRLCFFVRRFKQSS